ncbi:MAG: ABC transporter substrate-binding protein [Gemmatimonadetes bacterium]|nr:ABC transporter substrate-binding protein [Gemmatimonadota bacterium]
MSRPRRIARALSASGRFLFATALTGACHPVSPERPVPPQRPGATWDTLSIYAHPAARDTAEPKDSTSELAQAPPPKVLAVHIGSVLPTTGSPAFREYSRLIAEGIEVAASSYLGSEGNVTVNVQDDAGDPAMAASQTREIEASGAIGAVGFLESASLDAAAAARLVDMPLVSPTARVVTQPGVYTLSGPDPIAAAEVARYAAQAGFKRVAIVNSRAPESAEEADAFAAALTAGGIPTAGRFEYDAGQTSFGEPLKAAAEALRGAEIRALHLGPDDTLHVETLEPVALFLPVPPEDVELLAPQVTFFGLDTLGIQILGTSAWTDATVLQDVDSRHTDGVVATRPVGAGPGAEGYERFKAAYESHFQRTLVSPVPALGYDAAVLLLEAARGGARTVDAVEAALGAERSVAGATGIFSVRNGRVYRRTEVVRIEQGRFVPVVF